MAAFLLFVDLYLAFRFIASLDQSALYFARFGTKKTTVSRDWPGRPSGDCRYTRTSNSAIH